MRALALAVALAIVSPFLFAIAEANHPCTGDDCAVCQVIAESLQFEQAGFDTVSPAGTASQHAAFLLGALALATWLFPPETPVHLKVRIDD